MLGSSRSTLHLGAQTGPPWHPSDPVNSAPQTPKQILKSVFGYPEFRGHQAAIIEAVVGGSDAFVLMPTGGGKSLCYQIPALLRPGVGVVISPLIALMQDQVMALRQLGVRAEYLNSTLEFDEVRRIETALRDREVDLLYLAPERLVVPRTQGLLSSLEISLFAIDEAHCVAQWGHDFRPEYRQLRFLAERFPEVPRIALTATADERTRREILEELELQRAQVFVSSFDRPNLRYTISEGKNARQELWTFLEKEHPEEAGIVYCLSRRQAEETAEWLVSKGRPALPYHAGLPAETRAENQRRFLEEDGLTVVATIAFGMGIDKPDVRFVAHLSLPKSVEAYYQETGRAGRDGLPSDAWMAYQLKDVILLRRMLDESDAEDAIKRVFSQKLDAMLGLCETISCRRQAILSYFSESHPGACEGCDNCLTPPETFDATVEAQKALSCVFRTGQRFGVTHLIDVLRGAETFRIHDLGHDLVSTYGIGKELSKNQWRGIYRQLIARGFLKVCDSYGSLQLTEKSRPLLRGEEKLELRKLRKRPSKSSGRRVVVDSIPEPEDHALYEDLRSLRRNLAKERGVPAYVVFSDRTLLELTASRPATRGEMLEVHGVGERKFERFGEVFLDFLSRDPEGRRRLIEG